MMCRVGSFSTIRAVLSGRGTELFADSYRRLATGTTKLTALTETRQALRKKYPEPYHWSAFVYIGDPR